MKCIRAKKIKCCFGGRPQSVTSVCNYVNLLFSFGLNLEKIRTHARYFLLHVPVGEIHLTIDPGDHCNFGIFASFLMLVG